MARLGKTDHGYANSLRIHGSNQTTFAAGSYDITLMANNSEFSTIVTLSN